MNYSSPATKADMKLIGDLLSFGPQEIYDVHAHPHQPGFYGSNAWPGLADCGELGCGAHREALRRQTGARAVHGL